ncbi:hypothetical protein SAZ11_25090 [Streptomyces sp. FXJ1.4098]|nr:hypothetical protein [Streptomyces sp. FXJ1.4098]
MGSDAPSHSGWRRGRGRRRSAPGRPDPGDIVDRNKTDLYPVTDGVRPYLTKANNLAVTLPA